MSEMVGIIYSDGQLDLDAIQYECREQQWVPVLALKPKNDPDSSGVVLLFHRFIEAQKFIQLNLMDEDKKDWIKGVITFPWEDVQIIWKKYKVEPQYQAKKMSSFPDFNLSFEIIEMGGKPDLFVSKEELSHVSTRR